MDNSSYFEFVMKKYVRTTISTIVPINLWNRGFTMFSSILKKTTLEIKGENLYVTFIFKHFESLNLNSC